MARHGRTTDFSGYSLAQLVQMLYASDPGAVNGAADAWADVARSLYARAGDLEQQLREFEPLWTGGAADQYRTMIRSLIAGLRRVADVSRMVADHTYTAGEALQSARNRLPPTGGGVPAAATPGPGATPAAVPGASNAAVEVLSELAGQYAGLEASMPPVPDAASPPRVADILSGQYPRADAPEPASPPLFRDVYPNGLATAATALGGRFIHALPGLVRPAPPIGPQPGFAPGFSGAGAPLPAPVGDAGIGGGSAGGPPGGAAGGFSGGHGGGLGGAGVGIEPARPVASPSLAGSAPVAAAAMGVAGATGVAGVAGSPAPGAGGFFPPMIPPFGMGGAGEGNGRHVPHWLTEPEPDVVFGVPLNAVMAVIGEVDDAMPESGRWGL
jgi:uncharacterized protein YukE